VVPLAIPFTSPVDAFIVATVASSLLQVPPPKSVSVVVRPTQTLVAPPIAEGNGLTVTGAVIIQVVGKVYVMTGVPAEIPVTAPLVGSTVACALVVLQEPPLSGSFSVVLRPAQTVAVPVIADGKGLTTKEVDMIQPVGSVYVIFAVPFKLPITTPVELFTVATAVLSLLHVPDPPSVSPVVNPAHTFVAPPIGSGNGLTVKGVVRLQPVGNVYVIVGDPAATPPTLPVLTSTVAVSGSLLLQVPVPSGSFSVVFNPTQTLVVPVIADGSGFTRKGAEVIQPGDTI